MVDCSVVENGYSIWYGGEGKGRKAGGNALVTE